jgi:hypothetical protein
MDMTDIKGVITFYVTERINPNWSPAARVKNQSGVISRANLCNVNNKHRPGRRGIYCEGERGT